jgi:hypothetical protein
MIGYVQTTLQFHMFKMSYVYLYFNLFYLSMELVTMSMKISIALNSSILFNQVFFHYIYHDTQLSLSINMLNLYNVLGGVTGSLQ